MKKILKTMFEYLLLAIITLGLTAMFIYGLSKDEPLNEAEKRSLQKYQEKDYENRINLNIKYQQQTQDR